MHSNTTTKILVSSITRQSRGTQTRILTCTKHKFTHNPRRAEEEESNNIYPGEEIPHLYRLLFQSGPLNQLPGISIKLLWEASPKSSRLSLMLMQCSEYAKPQ
jgi:hypothetical protein